LWGVARKSLNLFLRGCLYNIYLRKRYRLHRIETLLEIPLDSKVAKGLKEQYEDSLPGTWPGLKRLESDESERFQSFATILAKKRKLPARVFLDHPFYLPSGRTPGLQDAGDLAESRRRMKSPGGITLTQLRTKLGL
jgi:hypothetical protein